VPTPNDLREAVSSLSVLAARDLRAVWRQVDDVQLVQEALRDLLPAVVQAYGIAATTVAADWYDDLRDQQNIDGRFFAITAELDDLGTDELAGWAVGPLYGATPDIPAARSMVEGGLQRRIANAARETVVRSSLEDPRAVGWQRSASGGCAFCQMIASRGAVFTEASADFASHDHCKCVATVAFDGRELPVKPYKPSSRDITDADRARVRAYLAQHHAG
jgi:hypothetical protein